MRALAVVAHSDDHVLWIGGTMLRLKDWTWDILSLCKSHNEEDFEPKRNIFNRSCEILGANKYSAHEFKDYQPRESMEPHQLAAIRNAIRESVGSEYDFVFTHSIHDDCEYGFHANHVEVREAVNELVQADALRTSGVMYFCYKSGGCKKAVIAELGRADYKIILSSDEIQKKRSLKGLFTWAKDDLLELSLWNNNEPEIEAFQARPRDLRLPVDFMKA